MSLRARIEEHRQEVHRLAREHGARRVRIFGSVARGLESPESDVDLLVEMAPERSLFDLIALEKDLEALLGCRVQVVSEGGLKPHVRERILSEAVAV